MYARVYAAVNISKKGMWSCTVYNHNEIIMGFLKNHPDSNWSLKMVVTHYLYIVRISKAALRKTCSCYAAEVWLIMCSYDGNIVRLLKKSL